MSEISKKIEELSPRKRELLELWLKERRAKSVSQVPSISRVDRGDVSPLSLAQQRLWFLDKLMPGSPVYNLPFTRRLSGPLDIDALKRSLNEILKRHEILRTVFPAEQGRPVGRILSALELELNLIDLRDWQGGEREAEARRLAREEARQPFDLSTGPLVRATLVRLADNEHVVLLTMHHIVSDGWSLGLFVKEMSTLYNAFRSGVPSPLPDLPIQYADYSDWQRERLQAEALQAQFNYWREQLAGAPPVLELPTDRPRSAAPVSQGATHTSALPGALRDAINAVRQQEGVTLFMILLAAFEVLLYRYTGQQDIVVGTPVANRNLPETETLIGFFVNTLVLRTDLSGDPTFRELLGQVHKVALEGFANQEVPFDKLVQDLNAERDLRHTPLFQVMFTLQNTPLEALELAGLSVSQFASDNQTSMFDLTLTLMERSDLAAGASSLVSYIEYNTALFDAQTIDRMARHFQMLLEAIAAHPDARLSQLAMMTQAEREQLLVGCNDTGAEFPSQSCFVDLFEAQVERTPNAVAVVFQDRPLTYAELNARANQLAAHLQSIGVGLEDRVGICLRRSLDVVIGMLAIMKAGGAYVPLDPAYPPPSLHYILNDANIAVVLTEQQLIDRLADDRLRLVCIDRNGESIGQNRDRNLGVAVNAENLAYVIYTSGSTGHPKGVLVTHRSLLNHNFAVIKAYELKASDNVLQFASISFDVAAEEIFPTLLVGASIVIRDDRRTTTANFLDLVESQQLTVINLPASFWHEWVDALAIANKQLSANFRLLVVGSEKISAERLATWKQMSGNSISLINAYGLTETTITTLIYSQAAGDDWRLPSELPIGRPINNTQVYVLDAGLQPVPIGVPGQLFIGGEGLARGYLNRPDATAERFIPNPLSREPGTRLYKTGDRVRYLADGNIEFMGRMDNQIKVRGFRIEPGEIEAALAGHAQVQEAVVIARDDAKGQKQLVGYVVGEKGQNLTSSALRHFLREKLPDYMVPSALVVLDALPLMANGKLNRAALPEPERRAPEMTAAYVAPRTELEKTIAAIWQEVLSAEKIGVNDNFFDLGGHSMLMAEIFAKLQPRLDREITMLELFEYPTVGSLTRYINKDRSEGPSLHQPPVTIEKVKDGKSRLRQQFRNRQQAAKRR